MMPLDRMSSKLAISISVSAGCVNWVAESRPVGDLYVYEVVVSSTCLKIFSDLIVPSALTDSNVIDM